MLICITRNIIPFLYLVFREHFHMALTFWLLQITMLLETEQTHIWTSGMSLFFIYMTKGLILLCSTLPWPTIPFPTLVPKLTLTPPPPVALPCNIGHYLLVFVFKSIIVQVCLLLCPFSVFVAKFEVYTKPMIENLVNQKLQHWDGWVTNIQLYLERLDILHYAY